MKQKQFDTGGPAFPQVRTLPCGSHEECEGLSVRDYFAAKAMQTILELWHRDLAEMAKAHDEEYPGLSLVGNEFGTPDGIAQDAYAMADAMLRERRE
jgi:hypothetical protein